jgi:hypothetical protein
MERAHEGPLLQANVSTHCSCSTGMAERQACGCSVGCACGALATQEGLAAVEACWLKIALGVWMCIAQAGLMSLLTAASNHSSSHTRVIAGCTLPAWPSMIAISL